MARYRSIALGLAVTLAAACSDSSAGTTSAVLDGPVIRYPEPDTSEGGEGASVEGQLVLDGDCLYVAGHDGGERYPIVWPAGTSWDSASESVISPSGARMPVGSAVSGGGGTHYVEYVGSSISDDAEALVRRCVDNTNSEVAFVNNNDDAIGPAS